MKNQLPLYWKCQLAGWSLAALYWGYTGAVDGHFNLAIGSFQFITDVAMYSLLTHQYRNFAVRHRWIDLEINPLLKRLVGAVLVLGLCYLVITTTKIFLFRLWFGVGGQESFPQFIELNGVPVFMAGIRLMSIWLLAYHLYHYAQREVRFTKENARLEIINRDARLQNLSAQLNPHLLFNSLNTIKSLVIDEPESARRAVDLLSDLLRTGLYTGNEALVSVKDELGLVMDYLELEKLRFDERLTYQVDFDDSLASVQIPRLSIQTLVENALKHGISTKKEGGLIWIQVLKEDEFAQIKVQNPGRIDLTTGLNNIELRSEVTPLSRSGRGAGVEGKEVESSLVPGRPHPNPSPTTGEGLEPSVTGLGLKNLTERLQLTYASRASFQVANEPEGLVSAIVRIPIA